FPELPARSKLRRFRLRACSFRHALFYPGFNEPDLLIGEPSLVAIWERRWLSLPRRHGVRHHRLGNRLSFLHHIIVGQQRKRRRLTGPMTRGTVVKNDGGDVAIEGDLRG